MIINQVMVPSDISTFEQKKKELLSSVKSLLREIKQLQDEIDDTVYSLYGLGEKEKRTVSNASSVTNAP
jgi:hypothetical protein